MKGSTSLATLTRGRAGLPPGTKTIALTCGHGALYARPYPVAGDTAYCRTCRDWVSVPDKPRRRSRSRAERRPGGITRPRGRKESRSSV